MRLALVVPAFPKLSETFIVSKAVGLSERGHEVHVVCGASDPSGWTAYGSEHAVGGLRDNVHLAPAVGLRRQHLLPTARALARARRHPTAVATYLADGGSSVGRRVRDLLIDGPLLDIRPDVVHFEFGSLAVGRTRVGSRLGTAVTTSFRGYDLNYVGLGHPDHFREVWDDADRVHLLGADLWRRALRRGAPTDLPHTLIPPAIDTSKITPHPARPGRLGTPEAPIRILSVGRMHWKKGYDDALDAISRLRDDGKQVQFRVIGDGDLFPAVEHWRRHLELDDTVSLLGARTPSEVSRELAWADVLLHAATSEGFGNAVVEAQAHGVPVVCTDADGLSENVEHEVTGIVVPRRDPRALSRGLARLADDEDLRRRMGHAARSRVEDRFRLDDQLDAWEQFYEAALASRARRGSAMETARQLR